MTEDEMYGIICGYEDSECEYHERNIELESENANLRELLLHMHTCMDNVDADGNHECFSCEYEGADCEFADRMRKLGIGVES